MNSGPPVKSKYTPLENHLKSKGYDSISMTFEEIECLLGFDLPASSRSHRAWWSNNPSNSVITYAWLSAGYETSDVDMAHERLTFRRANNSPRPAMSPVTMPKRSVNHSHPLRGALKGLFLLNKSVDLTQPADPEWGGE